MYRFMKGGFLLLLISFSFASKAQWYKHSFKVMGTMSHVEFWLDGQDNSKFSTEKIVTNHNVDKAKKMIMLVEQEMFRIDQQMSPYKEESELSKVNREAGNKAVTISSELFDILKIAHDISTISEGSFDITYASIGYQYDYRKKKRPEQTTIAEALPAINFNSVVLNNEDSTVYFSNKNVKIDLGGIAKGYAVKRCLMLLEKAGIKHALVSAGGDTGLLGDRNNRPWLVGIKHPRAEQKMAVHIPLENEAISTSGDYERFFIEDGIRYHHIINPKTGYPSSGIISVSVFSPKAELADALATSIFVMGIEVGINRINQLKGIECIVIDNQGNIHTSNNLNIHKI